MSKVKVFLTTYKRPQGLRRAINSLKAQTFEDWFCEVHNDDPDDLSIEDYLDQLNDQRFKYCHHAKNLGPVNTFNLMYVSTTAEYVSLLEDDNWWEPTFLQEMTDILDKHPLAEMAWANMYLWKENNNEECVFLDQTIWKTPTRENLENFEFGHYKQSYQALHSNGAMLIRNVNLEKYILPGDIRFDFVEPFRERAFNYPIILNHKPLANFNYTITTNRKTNIDGLHEHYILLISSFFEKISPSPKIADDIWKELRGAKVKSTNKLIYAGLIFKNCRFLLKNANLNEWLFFVAYNLKHPTVFLKSLTFKYRKNHLWKYLVNTPDN